MKQFTVGRVFGQSIGVLFRTLPLFLLVLIVFGGVEIYASAWVTDRFGWPTLNPGAAGLTSLLLSALAFGTCDALAASILVHGTLGNLRGERSRIAPSLGRGFAAWPRALPVAVFEAVCWEIAVDQTVTITIILLAANIVIGAALWVYVPVIVAERCGIVAGVFRTLALVAGNAWRIVVIFVALIVLTYGLSTLGYFAAPGGWTSDFTPAPDGTISLWVAIQIAVNDVTAIVTGVSYFHLQRDREGAPIAEVARVFD